jgi:hypothetical protein
VSNMFKRLFSEAGYEATVDEVFLQDRWANPQGLRARIMLFLGDPLMEVEVPWKPESLIQNWTVSI